MSDPILYKCTPRQARRFITEDILPAGLVPFVHSSPGMGKSAMMHSIADEYQLQLIDHRLSTSTPEDLSGLPDFNRDLDVPTATFRPFDTFPVESTPVPAGKQGWLLFLDEANSATKNVQAASYKLVLDKQVGQHKLNPRVAVAMAGNLTTDRAIVTSLSTAMQSRIVHLELELDLREFLEDVAIPKGWDGRILGYLSYKGLPALHDFRPDHDDKTFNCPRTWEFMNRLIQGKKVTEEKAALYAGTITSGTAADFVTYCLVAENLPKFRDIVGDPEGMFLPTDPPTRWNTVTHLMEHVDDDTFAPVAAYVNRLPAEFRVLFFRALQIRKPKLREHPVFRKALLELSRYLHDDLPTAA
jgi:hypothetical protein